MNPLESMHQINRDNQIIARVSVAVLKRAIREIEAQARLNGPGIMTGKVIADLNAAIIRATT